MSFIRRDLLELLTYLDNRTLSIEQQKEDINHRNIQKQWNIHTNQYQVYVMYMEIKSKKYCNGKSINGHIINTIPTDHALSGDGYHVDQVMNIIMN